MSNTRRAVLVSVLVIAACGLAATLHSAYRGHADDRDVNAVLTAYQTVKGTAIDSCATCHRSGDVPDAARPGALRSENHCDYCHAVHVAGKRPAKDTLNRYGLDYLAAGRGPDAVKALAAKDSDGDGFSNDVEFAKGTNPGDPASNPSAPVAPSRTLTVAEIRALSPVVRETVFLNTTKSKSGDSYSEYRGNSLFDTLEAIGLSDTAAWVDVMSLDGYERTFSLDELKRAWTQGAPVMGLDRKTLGPCGWVSYKASGLDPQRPLPPARIILAFEEDAVALEPARIDQATGRIIGPGPLRIIVPQAEVSTPDLPQHADPSCGGKVAPGLRFHEEYDHNAGKSSSAIVAVRVRPLPKGTRDVEWESTREQLIAAEKVVFFGALAGQGVK